LVSLLSEEAQEATVLIVRPVMTLYTKGMTAVQAVVLVARGIVAGVGLHPGVPLLAIVTVIGVETGPEIKVFNKERVAEVVRPQEVNTTTRITVTAETVEMD
jgi:hypothetical protein